MIFETLFLYFGKKSIFHVFFVAHHFGEFIGEPLTISQILKVARLEQNSTPQRRSHPWRESGRQNDFHTKSKLPPLRKNTPR